MTKRTLLPLPIFAEDAETTIPPNPVPGESYRDPAYTGTINGWPFETVVDSKDFNQTLFVETSLTKQLSDQGILGYSDQIDYDAAVGAIVLDDGGVYVCKQSNGPSSTVAQPSAGLPYWERVDAPEVSPINNDWNGYFDPAHQEQLPNVAGYPLTSGAGGTVYALDDEWSLNCFSGSAANTISSDSDGVIFSGSIYKKYEFETEQLNLIDVNAVPIYIKGEDGKECFVSNATVGVNVTKSASELRVTIDNSILATLGITKVWRFFVCERVGRVVELGPDESERNIRGGYIIESNADGVARIYEDGFVVQVLATTNHTASTTNSIEATAPFVVPLSTVTNTYYSVIHGDNPSLNYVQSSYIRSGAGPNSVVNVVKKEQAAGSFFMRTTVEGYL